ncbi:MAG: hypothetical protein JSS86_01525 [Cyanobacteria bacterium SZAS LIN-2]|nr:hypothetical protein [Cyanobacteria bacterium SZAS LIN-2]
MAQESDNHRDAPKPGHANGDATGAEQKAGGTNGLNSVDILGGEQLAVESPLRLPPNRSRTLPPIGTAEMLKDETIVLHLHAESADGKTHGDGLLQVHPQDRDYASIVDHIGGIHQGEIKFVSPWTDSTGQPTNSTPVKSDVVPEPGTTDSTTANAPNAAIADPIVPPSPAFTTDVTTTYNAMSAETRAIVSKSGAKVVGVHHLTDAIPELKGQAPRGWPAGATWDSVDGCWSARKNEIIVAEERQQITGQKWIPSGRVKEVLRHETGHAVDYTIKMLSEQDDFKKAYEDDLQAMPAADKAPLSYFLQPGSAGREETAAEGVADREGGATGGKTFHTDFSRTLKVINDSINSVAGSTSVLTGGSAPGNGQLSR